MTSSSSSSSPAAAGATSRGARPDPPTPLRGPALVLAAAHVASRVGAHLAGVRFDAGLLHHAWQLLDPSLLEHDLWRSAWYLHVQPPLFNVFVGLVLQLSPFGDAVTLAWVWHALGALLTWLVWDLGMRLGLGRWGATAAAVAICCGPGVLLYESWFQYELPVMVLLTATVDALVRWQHGRSVTALAATGALAAAAVLTRSLLHPVWFVVVVAVALVAVPRAEGPPLRRRLAVVALPVLLVGGVVVRNAVLFDTWQLSSWLGWNLHRIVFDDVDPAERRALVDDGVLSPISVLYINQPVDFYEPVLGPCTSSHPDVPALSEPTKLPAALDGPAGPDSNLNHECYLRVYDAYLDDALAMIAHDPAGYLSSVATAAELWALPTTDYVFVRGNAEAIAHLEAVHRRLVLLSITADPPVRGPNLEHQLTCVQLPAGAACLIPGGRYRFSLTVVAATLGAVVVGGRGAWRLVRRRDRSDVHWIVLGATIGWVTLASIGLELGENHRFRSVVEPLTLLVAAVALRRAVERCRERWWPDAQPSPTSTGGHPAGG